MEVVSTRVHQEMVIVVVQPSMRAPPLSCGADDVFNADESRRKEAKRKADERRSALRRGDWKNAMRGIQSRGKAAMDTFKQVQLEARTAAAVAAAASHKVRAAEAKASVLGERLSHCVTEKERGDLEDEMRKLKAELEWTRSHLNKCKKDAEKAQEREQTASAVMTYELATENPHLARTRAQEAVGGGELQVSKGEVLGIAGFEKPGDKKKEQPKLKKSQSYLDDLDMPIPYASFTDLAPLGKLIQRSTEKQKQAVCMASLERVVQLCMADTKGRIKDEEREPVVNDTVHAMLSPAFKESMLLIAIGSCALAALTTSKKPYPRTLQQAVLDSGGITVLVKAVKTLGPNGLDPPAKEALVNACRNNPANAKAAVKAGADWELQPATGSQRNLTEELVAAD